MASLLNSQRMSLPGRAPGSAAPAARLQVSATGCTSLKLPAAQLAV
jgi:hypothetical protein